MTTLAAGVRRSLLSLAVCAGLCWLATPAWAADPPCLDADGNPTGASTDQGIEDTGSRNGENATCDPAASAYGWRNVASGQSSSAFGQSNTATGDFSIAYGVNNHATGGYGMAFGIFNTASGYNSTALGALNNASGDLSSAFGFASIASGPRAIALGSWWDSNGDGVINVVESTTAAGTASVALGAGAFSWDDLSVAVGVGSVAGSDDADPTTGRNSVAVGTWMDVDADGVFDAGVDQLNSATAIHSAAFGVGNTASGASSSAFGYANNAIGEYSTAMGASSSALADYSTAVGYQSTAQESGVVSFGHAAGDSDGLGGTYADTRNSRLVHVAAGTGDTDAVNLAQMLAADSLLGSGFAAWFGGGASYAGGVFAAPAYLVQGGSYGNMGDAFAAIDNALDAINARADLAVYYDDPGKGTVTLEGSGGGGGAGGSAGGTQVKHVADATDPGDAVNLGQMQAGDAATLASANAHADAGDATTLAAANTHADTGDVQILGASRSYTDARSAATLASANAYTDSRFEAWNQDFLDFRQDTEIRFANVDQRIDRIGAMGTAMTQMAVNAAAGDSPRGRIAVGIGSQGGQGAISIGYGKRIGDRGSFSLGASFSGGESSAGAGFGLDL